MGACDVRPNLRVIGRNHICRFIRVLAYVKVILGFTNVDPCSITHRVGRMSHVGWSQAKNLLSVMRKVDLAGLQLSQGGSCPAGSDLKQYHRWGTIERVKM
jgi:hypothetical protein